MNDLHARLHQLSPIFFARLNVATYPMTINYVLITGPFFDLHLSRFQHKNQYFFIVFVEFDSTCDGRFFIGIDGVRPHLHHGSCQWSLSKYVCY